MERTTVKKQASFRLNSDLLDRLKIKAKKENRSLSNYVESILFDTVYREPNEETLAAMREVESGAELEMLDLDNFKDYVASL